jgi:hypothetical protein
MLYLFTFLLGAWFCGGGIALWYVKNRTKLRKRLEDVNAAIEQQAIEAARLQSARLQVEADRAFLESATKTFNARQVGYDSLAAENQALKQDLFNLSVRIRKQDRDNAAVGALQKRLHDQSSALAEHYLDEKVTWLSARLTINNYSSSKDQLVKAIEECRSIGYPVTAERETALIQDLKVLFETVVRREAQREEQARIKAQIREEERIRRETERELADAEREQMAIRAAIDRAMAITLDEHSAEVEALKLKLEEAEQKAARAISQAQLTKAGHVYVISNIGTFGEKVFKIGMTRRLEPLDRVRELGDASVPFPFDVHMMISCDDAPSLENALHRKLHKSRMNKVNPRKEFFRTDFDEIRKIVEEHHGTVDYVADPEALQYRESLNMPDDDLEFIEQTFDATFDEESEPLVDA